MNAELAIVALVFFGALCSIYEKTRAVGLISLFASIALSIFQGWN